MEPSHWKRSIGHDALGDVVPPRPVDEEDRDPVWVGLPEPDGSAPRPGDGRADGEPENGEDGQQRRNRELIELLNELRVALPGVQVLFAFLLTVPFSDRFADLSQWQRIAYFATFIGTAVATALFMAPTSYHRIRFRQGDKERMLRTANAFTIVGIAFLALSLAGAVFLAADLVFGLSFALGMAAAILVLLMWAWFGLPIARRARDGGPRNGGRPTARSKGLTPVAPGNTRDTRRDA